MYRTAVIGGGVVGGMIAHAISKYEGSLVILEKEHDVAMGQSKANSGIVHAGYDCVPGTLHISCKAGHRPDGKDSGTAYRQSAETL